MDGYITIGTKLDTKEFDKDYKKIEHVVDKELGLDFVIHRNDIPETIENFDKLMQKKRETDQVLSSNNYVAYDSSAIQSFVNGYETSAEQATRLKEETAEAKKQAKELAIAEKQASANTQMIASGFKSVGSSLQNAVSRVARLTLGIFGIRSAYLALRRASSDLAGYDQQYASNIEYIRYALTQMIAPVLRYIVNLAGTLLSYINAIVQGWFGINLFSNASAKSFQKMKVGAGGVSKAVKEIKKQLAGFDEMNVLNDQSSSGRRWSAVLVVVYYQTLIYHKWEKSLNGYNG